MLSWVRDTRYPAARLLQKTGQRHNLADASLSFFTNEQKPGSGAKKIILRFSFQQWQVLARFRIYCAHMSTTPAKLKALTVTIVASGVAHAQSPAEDALASAVSGLESATTEWPGLEMWPSGAMTLDDARDEFIVTLPREDALTKTGSAESAVTYRAPMCDKHTHPSVPCLKSPSCLLMDFTVSGAAAPEQIVEGWDTSGNQCCKISHVAEVCTGGQVFGPTASVLDEHDKNEASPRLHRGPRQYTCTIGNATALRLLHIPIDMHRQLGLSDMYPKKAAGQARRTSACSLNLATMTDKAAVVMVRTISKGQRHRRFSTGWREFCARAGVEIGDELVFKRTRTGNELTVRVVKAGLSKARRGHAQPTEVTQCHRMPNRTQRAPGRQAHRT
jgi:hypothetical protein